MDLFEVLPYPTLLAFGFPTTCVSVEVPLRHSLPERKRAVVLANPAGRQRHRIDDPVGQPDRRWRNN
jgi:hypothetical protein